MKALIVEDEALSALHLKTLLAKAAPEIEVVQVLDTVKSAVAYLKGLPAIDLIFLDVHLADGISFEIFDQVEVHQPVIFTTAFDEYAIKAFKVNSIDYLLKPIGISDVKHAINKFISRQNAFIPAENKHKQAFEIVSKTQKTRFIVKMGENISSIKIEDIAAFTADEGVVMLITSTGKRFTVDYTMDGLELLLNENIFFRINRKMLLNIEQISQVQTYFNARLKIKMKTSINDDCIVSRERVNDFKRWLDR
jgi:DNA-binding LytR/AlgR family response regulator